MAKDTDPLTRAGSATGTAAGAEMCPVHGAAPCPAPHPSRSRRRTRRWTLMLFVLEVAVVIALVWFSWAGGSWS